MKKKDDLVRFGLLGSIVYIFPIISLPASIWGMVKRKGKKYFILFAFFMGLLAILWPPIGDFYRYALDFENMKGMDWNVFQLFMLIRFDVFLPYLSYFLANNGGSIEIIRFLFNFLGYLIIFDVLRIIIHYNQLYKNRKIYVCALFLIVPFTLYGYLFRSGLGAVVLLDGAIRWFYLKQKKGLLLCVISSLIHFSNIPFLFLFLIGNIRILHFRYQFVLIVIFLSLLLDVGGVAEWLLSLLPLSDNYIGHIYEYIDGSQSESITQKFSLYQLVIHIFNNIVNYIWIIIYVVYYKKYKGNLPMMRFTNSLLLILLLSASFPIIYGRYFNLAFSFMSIIILMNLDLNIIRFSNLKRLTYLKIAFLFLGYYQTCRYPLTISYEYKLFTSSLSEIVTTHYSESWIVNNLDEEGNFYARVQKYGKGN